ncbi:MAG: cytochrome c peroxidase [Polyangiaceae bacterium]
MNPRRAIVRGDRSISSVALTALVAAALGGLGGCQAGDVTGEDGETEIAASASHGNHPGRELFEEETFGGNGRTCLTCHSQKTGTLSVEDVQDLYSKDPGDPLFSHDGSDDFQGNGTSRIRADATILIRRDLPPGVFLLDDPGATSVVVSRGIPTTLNTPALDPVLMYDGRDPDLPTQALGAIHGHAQNTVEPTAEELADIADFQKTEHFFSSPALRHFAEGGPAPELPQGHTASEKRGRLFFEDAPVPTAINQDTPRKGLCAICHSGPMLNTSNGFNPLPVAPFPKNCTPPGSEPFPPLAPGEPPRPPCACDEPATQANHVPAGTRFQSILVSELNFANNPVHLYAVPLPDSSLLVLPSPDPGVSLTTGNFIPFPNGQFSNFKIPTLWGVKKTAPYFHDNSRKTLEGVLDHYTQFFAIASDCNIDGDPPLVLTDQDRADLLAFMKLL